MEAFVYCWTDHKTGRLYIGSHKGTEDDGYICSSKYMLNEYKERSYDFTRQILAHGTYDDIRVLETAILKATNAALDEQFYNKHNGDGRFYCDGHTEETKTRMSKSHKGKVIPDVTKERMRASNIGQKRSEDTKRRMKNAHTKPWLGKKHNTDTIDKMKKAKPSYFTTPKGKLWWNNGTIETQNKECPGDNWIRGRLSTRQG